jgi:glycosyltransferase involved in cell wall biosynthesis
MNQAADFAPIFNQHAVCVLIPTYNNAASLEKVIMETAQYTRDILVVNDGSVDATAAILRKFSFLKTISFPGNRGKGAALKAGFHLAFKHGFRYAITLDSDGQHYPADLPLFLEAMAAHPDALFIGARNMNQENVPGKSSFGNKFSNFWFWLETGIRLPDTQSGYRLYPLEPLQHTRFFSTKYEFEIEVPVRMAWKGMPVKCIPVSVYYPPVEERVSHFRPFKDFCRISILNTFLTFIALFWIHPRNFFIRLGNREERKQMWQQYVVASHESNLKKATSIAFGIFMGIFPVWGFQLAIGIPLALYFKLNKPLFLLAANISIFPLTPLIWILSLIAGKMALGYSDWAFHWKEAGLEQFKEAGIAFFLGGVLLAVICSLIAFLISWLLLHQFRSSQKR